MRTTPTARTTFVGRSALVVAMGLTALGFGAGAAGAATPTPEPGFEIVEPGTDPQPEPIDDFSDTPVEPGPDPVPADELDFGAATPDPQPDPGDTLGTPTGDPGPDGPDDESPVPDDDGPNPGDGPDDEVDGGCNATHGCEPECPEPMATCDLTAGEPECEGEMVWTEFGEICDPDDTPGDEGTPEDTPEDTPEVDDEPTPSGRLPHTGGGIALMTVIGGSMTGLGLAIRRWATR